MASILTQEITYLSADEMTSFVVNDQASIRSGWAVAPHYYIKVETIDGWYGTDISSESHPIPHAIGDRSGDSYRKGKGISINGYIEGRTIGDMEVAAAYLKEMFWDVSPRKLTWTEAGISAYYICRVLNDVSVTETYDTFNPRWTWTVGLRIDDPRPRKVSDDTLVYSWMT